MTRDYVNFVRNSDRERAKEKGNENENENEKTVMF